MPSSAEIAVSDSDRAASPVSRRVFISVLVIAAAAFPLLHLAIGGLNYWLHMALFLFMNIAIASSWNIIGGYAGYISLGHNVFFAIGGYSAAILFAYFGISPFIAFPLCGLPCLDAIMDFIAICCGCFLLCQGLEPIFRVN